MNGFRASSQAEDNCAAVAFFLSANCLTSSTTGVFADLVSGEKRGNITFESDSPVQVIPWDEADSQLFASPAAYRRDPYGSHFSRYLPLGAIIKPRYMRNTPRAGEVA
jgi:hypothetical protein